MAANVIYHLPLELSLQPHGFQGSVDFGSDLTSQEGYKRWNWTHLEPNTCSHSSHKLGSSLETATLKYSGLGKVPAATSATISLKRYWAKGTMKILLRSSETFRRLCPLGAEKHRAPTTQGSCARRFVYKIIHNSQNSSGLGFPYHRTQDRPLLWPSQASSLTLKVWKATQRLCLTTLGK